MKINTMLFLTFLISSMLLALPSCEKDGKCNETNISESGGDESHNFGLNCMSCHVSGGEGEGCFSIAGRVSNSSLTSPLTAGTVKLFTEVNGGGTLKHTIEIDSKGNFHTTESIDYTGLYAAIIGSSGTTNYMSTSLSSGACNSCHGASTSKLWAN